MTATNLPLVPAPASMSLGLVDASNILSPAFGGDDQELLRKGTRNALTYQMPPMRYETAMGWSALRKKGALVRMRVYQPGFDTGAPGAPKVDGAGQAGSSLVVKGLTPHYVVRQFQFLNVITSDQWFLYQSASEVVADSAGEVTIALMEMLRRPHADNDLIELADPLIEGFVRDLGEWAVGTDRLVGLQFTVRERE